MTNIIIYSSCQGDGIETFLKIGLPSKYFKISKILSFKKIRDKSEFDYDLLKNCDIFIYQPVNIKYGKYSTDPDASDGIFKYLRNGCTKISFPFVYNSSLWSMFEEGDDYENSKIILKLKNEGKSLEDILKLYDDFELDFEYDIRNKYCISCLKQRELTSDVKISGFIEENLIESKILLTQNHPTSCVLITMTNEILNLLGKNIKISNIYDENISNLPEKYLHNKYDIEHWKFKYEVKCDGDEWTKSLIKKVYNKSVN